MNIDDTLEKSQVFQFVKEIEKIRRRDNIKYMEAIVYFCEENNIEVESIASVIMNNTLLLARIQEEAEQLNYLEKRTRLPL